MPDHYLECRVGNHDMPFSGTKRQLVRENLGRGTRDTVHITATCRRCGSQRFTVRDRYDFQLIRVWYDLADGYANPVKGDGQIPRAVAGLELLRRYPPDGE